MKILFVITSLDVGGAERQVLDLAQRLVELDNEVLIVYLTGRGTLVSSKLAFGTVGLNCTKSAGGFLQSIFKVRALVASFRPDVVHSHMYHANIIARIVRVIAHVPRLICTAHSNNEGGTIRMLAYRLTNFLASVTTNVSRGAVEAFEKKGAIKQGEMLSVPNGVDTARFSFSASSRSVLRNVEGIEDDKKIILAVGRLVEAKNYAGLLSAFGTVCEFDQYTTLWIVGDGELKNELVSLCIKLGIAHRVKFWGMRPDVETFYSAADVYVLSSAWEGFGLVVAEAMAAERVVVATDCGGVKEVIGEDGFLVEPGNSEELAVALKGALVMDAADARLLGKRARERVINIYSIDRVVARWLQLYRP
ncbi:glycosyltransferase [Pseudomonas sp. PB3P13]